jgi:hypothetical protein
MLSIILWVIGGLIALSILFFVLKVFLILIGMKKILTIVKEEVEHIPQDYQNARKEVTNENSSVASKAAGAAKQVAKTGWRIFRKM